MAVSSTTKKVASNTIYQLVGKFISLSITVLATMIIARTYGKTGYGEFSLMQSWPALFFIIADFGLNAIAAKDLSKDWSKAGKYIGNIFVMRIIFSIFLAIVLGAAMRFFPYSEGLIFGIRLGLLLVLTQALYTTANIVFQVKMRYDLAAIGYVAGYITILIMVLILSFSKADVVWVNFSYVIGGFITFAFNYHYLKKLGLKLDMRIDMGIWKYLLSSSLPLGMMFLFSQFNFKEDALLMSFLPLPQEYGLDNTETVAVYSLPYKVFEVSLVMPVFFMNSVYPVMVSHSVNNKKKLKEMFLKSIKFLALAGFVVGIIGVLFAPFVIKILGGDEFVESVVVLRILLCALILYYLTNPIAWLIVVLDHQKALPLIYFVGALLNVTLNLIFIPKYSFYAASIITHISEFIILLMLIFAVLKAWKLKYAK